jgi:hypothetical protein
MTYGVNGPRGLEPVNSGGGYTWSGQTNEYPITSTYASSMFTGDPVTLATDGTVIRATASTAVLGVFMGCKYIPSTNNSGTVAFPYWPGNPGVLSGTTPVAMVIDDPMVQYTIQETDAAGASGTPLTQAAVGNNANFLYTAGNTRTGQSGVSLNNASTATTLVQNLKLVRLDPTVGNATGAFANWVVQINNDVYKAGSTRP